MYTPEIPKNVNIKCYFSLFSVDKNHNEFTIKYIIREFGLDSGVSSFKIIPYDEIF